jgi:dTDP-4-amino-4,6-dideoxygalactose transaminase
LGMLEGRSMGRDGGQGIEDLLSGIPACRPCIGIGIIDSFSSYANKLTTTDEGSTLPTNVAVFTEIVSSWQNLCFRTERRFCYTELGYNFRLCSLLTAPGLAQLRRFDSIMAKIR